MARKRGFNHLPAVIRRLPEAAGEHLVEKAVVDIAAGAGSDAPIDTGALADSYTWERDGLTGTAGTNMEYGPHVEYGTINTNAQPHLVPNADRVADSLNSYAKAFGDDLEEAARRG